MATTQFMTCCAHSQWKKRSNITPLKLNLPFAHFSMGFGSAVKTPGYILKFRPFRASNDARPRTSGLMNMAAAASGESNERGGILNLDEISGKVRKLWDNSPQPVKIFPWNSVLDNLIHIILDILLSVVKLLCVPLLVVSSLSEFSYCAHEHKSFLIPFPFLAGVSVAGILNYAALESSPSLKRAEVPWHLIAIAVVFTLLKLPGPYYPYWGRILIPHFANGALCRTVWLFFLWYRSPSREEALPRPALAPSQHNML
ncbi:hypothetical protein DM860_003221 [Cuscuta australis]|uniref:Uncharacterized protein n=1 Tax=Cuscuta australis TaxID=267555 RepID=A0A328D5G5_9ASTE|nr:hypothetical protein DM860_003221 [Cuscuta australis]